MPLDEIPANVRRTQSTKQNDSDRMDMGNDAFSHATPAPSAVQNMLKTTTELGDVGIFARHSRLPRSRTSTSLDSRVRTSGSGSFNTHRSHGQHPRQDRPRMRSKYMSSPGQLKRHDTIQSSMIAYQYQPHSRRPRPRPGPVSYYYPSDSHRSQHILHSHRSLASLRGSNGSLNALSPYDALSPGLSRPGLRRSASSVRSNMYDYSNQHGGNVPKQFSLDTIPRSPRSMSSVGADLHDHQAEFNASVGSYRPSALPTMGTRRYYAPSQYSLSRTATPAPVGLHHRRIDSTISLRSAPTSPTDSIGPFYYDYSESFHGGETVLLPPHSEHPSILELHEEDEGAQAKDARTPFGTVTGSAFTPAELPTRHSRRVSEQSVRSRHSRRASNKSAKSQLSPTIEMPAEYVEQIKDKSCSELKARRSQSEPDGAQPIVQHHRWAYGRNSTHGPQDWPSPSSRIVFTSACRSPRNLSDLAARAHSPALEGLLKEMHSIDSVTRDSVISQGSDVEGQCVTATRDAFDLPELTFRPLSMGTSAPATTYDSPVSVHSEPAEIVSPRPERPASSESRKRFTRILDMGHTPTSRPSGRGRRASAYGPGSRLEPVGELSSPVKTPTYVHHHVMTDGHVNGKTILDSPESDTRWSGVTSQDKSTVDSVLERHIECLGLKPEEESQSECSASSVYDDADDQYVSGTPNVRIPGPRTDVRDRSHQSSLQRPTSLSTDTQKQLIPQRLFAGMKTSNLRLAGPNSESPFSLTWTDERMRPSHGWLSLHSASKLGPDLEESRQTLLSGEYADVESQADRKFKIRRHSSPHLPLISSTEGLSGPPSESGENAVSCRRWNSARVSRHTSQRRRKLKLHLKIPIQRSLSPTSDEWVSTKEKINDGESELQHFGMTRVPLSALDGFAELSGDSALASQRSMSSGLNSPRGKPPESWSNIVAAMPLPPAKDVEVKRTGSVNTIGSQKRRPNISDPINNSRISSRRQSREIRARSSAPRLARPDLGPSMRASQFDLSSGFCTKSPIHKVSSFLEPQGLLKGSRPRPDHGCRKGHQRYKFRSLRQIMPASMRGFASSPPLIDTPYRPFIVSQSCRTQSPMAPAEQSLFPETVAMSDFAYRKHKLLERFRDWCNRLCFNRKQRSTTQGGLLV